MRWLINILYLLGLIVGLPFFVYKMATAGKYRRGLAQRFGNVDFENDGRPVIWLHGVSVGELQLSKPLVSAIEKAYPGHRVVISHTTRTGEDVAAQTYPNLTRFYFPLDFSWVVGGLMKRLRPSMIVLVELELWPNFLCEAKRRGIPVLLANGRISAKSAKGYARFAWFFRRPFSAITVAAVQNDEYAERMRGLYEQMKLDAARVRVAGNIKFDAVPSELDGAARAKWRAMLGLRDDELLLVCGSTHPGEHEHLPACYREWREAGANLRMVVVPRHPERWVAVREAFRSAEVALVDRSSLSDTAPLEPSQTGLQSDSRSDPLPPCILLDKMGELGSLYHAADLVFVGGSLIPHGGQNMLEPAGLGLPVVYGPHTHNFKAVVRELREANAAVEVRDIEGLVAAVKALVAGPERRIELGTAAKRVIASGKGSIARHMREIDSILQ